MKDDLKDYLDIENVTSLLQYYGAKDVTVNGDFIRSTCPIHKGDNPTMYVWNLKTHLWYCHKEKIGGDLIRLHAIINDLSEKTQFIQIVNELCSMLGIDKEKLNFDKMQREQRKELREWMNYVNGKKLCNKEYDINLLGTMQNINIYRNLTKETLRENNVYYAKDINRIAFEILDEHGKCVGATCRTLNKVDKIKWLHRPKGIDTGLILYNLNNVIKKNYTSVYIVEGCMDVLTLKQLGIENVVGSFGCGLTDEQIELLEKYFYEITLFYDNDEAGLIGNIKSIEKCKNKFDVYAIDFEDVGINDAGEITDIDTFNSLKRMYYTKYIDKLKGDK